MSQTEQLAKPGEQKEQRGTDRPGHVLEQRPDEEIVAGMSVGVPRSPVSHEGLQLSDGGRKFDARGQTADRARAVSLAAARVRR